MGMTDPIADMLTRIRNAARARHQDVDIPWSRTKEGIARLLRDEGYLWEVKRVKVEGSVGEKLRIEMKYDREKNPVITGIRRVSRPGLRVYVGYGDIRPVRRGLGIHVLSTSKGILVDREARKAKVGGEIICSVW